MADQPVIQNTPYTEAQNAMNAPDNPNASSTLQDPTAVSVPNTNIGAVTPSVAPTPISVDTLGKGINPVTIPQATPYTNPFTGTIVSPPSGTVPDKNGMATIPQPPVPTTTPDTGRWIKTQLASLGNVLGTKSAVTTQLNNSMGIDSLTKNATDAYNNYNTAKLALDQQVANLQTNPNGMTASGVAAAVANAQRTGNANLANLAVIAQASQGNLTAAQKIIDDKIAAQFQPVNDQIDFLTKFAQVNNNDLTDSQKETMQTKADQLKTDSSAVQTAASDIHQTLLKNNAPASAYSAVDQITQKYASGQLSASEAQAQMYAAAGKYTASAENTAYTPGANPVVDSHIANVLSGNETMAQVPSNLRNAVSVGLNSQPAAAYSPLAASRYTTAANKIATNFISLPQYTLTANGLPYLQRIDAAIKTPGSVSDQDLLDSLTKLNTAGNAISDAQVKIITDGRSLSDTASVYGNKLQNGGVLSDSQRQQIQSIAKAIYANYQKGYQPVYDQATAQLKAAGIPKAFWTIPDLNNLSAQATGTQNTPTAPQIDTGAKTVTAGGKVYTFPTVDQLNSFLKDAGLQ